MNICEVREKVEKEARMLHARDCISCGTGDLTCVQMEDLITKSLSEAYSLGRKEVLREAKESLVACSGEQCVASCHHNDRQTILRLLNKE